MNYHIKLYSPISDWTTADPTTESGMGVTKAAEWIPAYYPEYAAPDYIIGLSSTSSALNIIERQTALNAIGSIASLAENWDGYGSASVGGDIIQTASTFLSALASHIPTPEVYANPHGTISMEWENDLGRAHLEFGRTTFSLYFRPSQGPTLYRDGAVNEIDQSKRKILGSMYALDTSQDYTINQIHMVQAA